MSKQQTLKGYIVSYNQLKDQISTYQEVAAMRMRKIKKRVLQNRQYLDGIADLYKRVYVSYESASEHKKNSSGTPSLEKSGSVAVLLSANTGLYGAIVNDTVSRYLKEVLETGNELVVLGKLGKDALTLRAPSQTYTYFDFPDSGVDTSILSEVLKYLVKFENIVVYHGLFKTVLAQVPRETFLTGDVKEFQNSLEHSDISSARTRVILEPDRGTLMSFFETQLLGSLFEHITYESSLSKFASRMVSLEDAIGNIDKKISDQKFLLTKERHKLSNRRQQDVLSSISLWS
jgi:F0F1-type ATP synthase gamma subunit